LELSRRLLRGLRRHWAGSLGDVRSSGLWTGLGGTEQSGPRHLGVPVSRDENCRAAPCGVHQNVAFLAVLCPLRALCSLE